MPSFHIVFLPNIALLPSFTGFPVDLSWDWVDVVVGLVLELHIGLYRVLPSFFLVPRLETLG